MTMLTPGRTLADVVGPSVWLVTGVKECRATVRWRFGDVDDAVDEETFDTPDVCDTGLRPKDVVDAGFGMLRPLPLPLAAACCPRSEFDKGGAKCLVFDTLSDVDAGDVPLTAMGPVRAPNITGELFSVTVVGPKVEPPRERPVGEGASTDAPNVFGAAVSGMPATPTAGAPFPLAVGFGRAMSRVSGKPNDVDSRRQLAGPVKYPPDREGCSCSCCCCCCKAAICCVAAALAKCICTMGFWLKKGVVWEMMR